MKPEYDITGLKFNKLTVISIDYKKKGKNTYWLCQCECGNQTSCFAYSLKSGRTKSCGCLKHETGKYNFINLTGQKFGTLTVLGVNEYIYILNKKMAVWNCQCECGKIIKVLGKYLRDGKRKNCGCKKVTDQEASINRLFYYYKHSAKKRSIEFYLNLEDFSKLIRSKCHYCNEPPYKIHIVHNRKINTLKWNGIDRVDNNKSYSLNNCVSCCTRCNHSKRILSKEKFLELVKLIYLNIDKPKEKVKTNKISYKYMYNYCKKQAKRRNIDFDLEDQVFFNLIFQNCFYCGEIPNQGKNKNSKHNGIDRLENDIGYTESNCVTCCTNCNYVKHTMNYNNFVKWIKKVYENNFK